MLPLVDILQRIFGIFVCAYFPEFLIMFCLTCSRQGSHEVTKTRRKDLQFADLFSLQPSYQTCGVLVYVCMMSVVLVVLHLRAYTLIAQIGSNVGGIARLESCRGFLSRHIVTNFCVLVHIFADFLTVCA